MDGFYPMGKKASETMTEETPVLRIYHQGIRTGVLLGIFWTAIACFVAITLVGVMK